MPQPTPRIGAMLPHRLAAGVCIIHLIRGSFRYASRRYWDQLARDLKPIYTAPTVAAAEAALDTLEDKWGQRYPAIIRLWRNAWNEFIPFLDYDVSDPPRHLLHQRHREPQRPLPARGQSTRALPQRASRDEMPVPGHQIAGPERHRPDQVGSTVEASPERVRHHLRRPYASGGDKLMNATYTVRRTVPLT